MATLTTAQFGSSSCPQVQLVVTQSSSTATTATLSWTLKWVTHGYTVNSSVAKNYSVKIDGKVVKSGTFSIGGKSSQTITSGTVTITKGTSARSIALWFSFEMNFTWSGTYAGTKTASGSISVAAKTSYKISYNANGGSGAPSQQTKWHGTNITLSSTKPTRTGYTFKGWATSSTGGVAYAAGASYTANASVTLYAVWQAITYKVTYNANGGSGAPAQQTKTYGVTLKLSTTKPTRTNYNFKGWAKSATGAVAYAAGANYTSNAAITLYAVWELAYKPPTISSVKVTRCNSSGTTQETGTYCKITFNWSCSQLTGSNPVTSVTVSWLTNTKTISASGNSGSASVVVGDNALNVDKSYEFTIKVTDSKNGTTSVKKTLGGARFPIDFKAGGKGVSIGKPAELNDAFDVNYKAYFRQDVVLDSPNSIIAKNATDGTYHEAFQAQNQYGNTIVGYGNWDARTGNTNIYGHNITFGISDLASPGTYKPYYSRGDTISITLRTAGYVTNSGRDISFWVPMSKPIIGSPTATATSLDGFVLRQNTKYTHGSAASVYVKPDSYDTYATYGVGVYIKVVFTNTTNVTNNDAIGIYWDGKITFS
jgi:uncharacterized repeat protein (TIGR02543 family)